MGRVRFTPEQIIGKLRRNRPLAANYSNISQIERDPS